MAARLPGGRACKDRGCPVAGRRLSACRARSDTQDLTPKFSTIGEMVFLNDEAGVAVMSPLNDVLGKTRKMSQAAAGHGGDGIRFCQLNRA